MSEGRKCWIDGTEGRAFTLAELAARDEAKEKVGYDKAMSQVAEYTESTPLLRTAFKAVEERGIAQGLEMATKSPAQIRREALEEAAKLCDEEEALPMNAVCNGCKDFIALELRALAEGEE